VWTVFEVVNEVFVVGVNPSLRHRESCPSSKRIAYEKVSYSALSTTVCVTVIVLYALSKSLIFVTRLVKVYAFCGMTIDFETPA
jgi:hypothetical protein